MTENQKPTNTSDAHVLTLEDILRGGDSPAWPVTVETMEKGGQAGVVFMRSASALEMMQLMALPTESEESTRERVRLVVKCITDKDGSRLVPDDKIDEAALRIDTQTFALLFRELMKRAGVDVEKATADAAQLAGGGEPGNA